MSATHSWSGPSGLMSLARLFTESRPAFRAVSRPSDPPTSASSSRFASSRRQTGRRLVARIPALAAPKHDREGDQRQLIDEACGKQRLVEHATALDEQVRSIAGLETRDSLGGIADEELQPDCVPRLAPSNSRDLRRPPLPRSGWPDELWSEPARDLSPHGDVCVATTRPA